MALKAPFILALCEAAQQPGVVPFGVVTRTGSQTSTFSVKAPKLIQSLVRFSPARETVAIEFLNEFHKVSRLRNLVASVLDAEADAEEAEANQWAQSVVRALDGLTEHQISIELKPVLDLTSEYLNHLLIAVRNPGGTKTPQESVCPTPGVIWTSDRITALIREAKRNQGALKKLVFARDGYTCALTGHSFDPNADTVMKPRCAHILPFSIGKKRHTLRAIETFTGREFSAEDIIENINHPRNAFHVESNAHEYFDELNWGIEATIANGEAHYFFRQVGPTRCGTITVQDGNEIFFNGGVNGEMIDGPDPGYCNLKLAIARVMHASGAAEIIDKIYGDADDDEFLGQPVYFGGPYISDEELCYKLHDRLAPYV